jgi:hypothetical protein
MKARKKAVIVAVERFYWVDKVWPKGVFAVSSDGTVFTGNANNKRRASLWSDEGRWPIADVRFSMWTEGGIRDLYDGDYIVSSPSGCRYPVSYKSFHENYEVIDEV